MTPMMEQYFEVKKEYKDYLLFYRIGDFYELFYDDAKTASSVLELTLTGRDCGEDERAPMCGVPYHAVENYIGKLVANGYKIAICEQVENPALAKGLVKREVIRIITPGTVIESSLLSDKKNNYLAAIALIDNQISPAIGVSFCDISTGQLSATMFTGDNLFDRLTAELATYMPSEIITNSDLVSLGSTGEYICGKLGAMLSERQADRFKRAVCEPFVTEHFKSVYSPNETNLALTLSIGALLSYIEETQKTDLSYISSLNIYTESQYLELDANTRRNLELCETMRTKEKKGSLLWVLDKTRTSMGARMLRRYVEQPLVNDYYINRRLDAVDELVGDFMLREECAAHLKGVLDLERLTTKIVYSTANGRDLLAIKNTISVIPVLRDLLSNAKCEELCEIYNSLDPMDDLRELLSASISEDAPLVIREGGIIADGYNSEVDHLRSVVTHSKDIISELAEKERNETGIRNLKIGYNRVFGYYIEVTQSQFSLVPERYIRKQTLSNCERYITQELKETEATILGAADKLNSLEYELFREICGILNKNLSRIQKSATMLAKLDVYISLAETAVRENYVRPEISYGDVTDIRDGRHPVVEKFVSDSYFVPNDTYLDTGANRLMLITGPNMAGKSTYMRQVALITLMAQIGSFVPAKEARISICDKIFTRVGASDDLASGQSTFMLEMNECAYILKNATRRSLIIYDEIGRGTSTYDGMSIARAIAEYTASKISAKTLFATHYHELCELEQSLPGVVNYNIAAKKKGDDITFLRKIVRGAADDSYGIEVAKLAGVPNEIIKRAKEVLADILKSSLHPKAKTQRAPEPELTFEAVLQSQLAEAIKAIDINTLTPIEAMNELYKLKKLLS
jgi:DNA mismatch repair protein MutS